MNKLPPSEDGMKFPADEYAVGARVELLKNWRKIRTSYDFQDSRVKNITIRLRQSLDIPPDLIDLVLEAVGELIGIRLVKVVVLRVFVISLGE